MNGFENKKKRKFRRFRNMFIIIFFWYEILQ